MNNLNRYNIIGGNSIIGGNRFIGSSYKPTINSNVGKKTDTTTKIVTYSADKSGCGHYRMIWPSYVLNSVKEYLINDCKRVILNPEWYSSVDAVRFQRQVSNEQTINFRKVRDICDKVGARLMYELDDIPFYEDIPLYNKNRGSYSNPQLRKNIEDMMNMSDEITVSTKFMKDYFLSKINNKKITHIPNMMPQFWADRYYDENALKINFDKNKKRPRILYAGSASHYAINVDIEDDFSKLVPYVKKTMKKYQWVFFGGVPRGLIPDWKAGRIEYHEYVPVVTYSEVFKKLKATVSIAPLLKSNFNRAKSNIKLIEAAAFGLPCICQDDIEPYEDAIYKFDNEKELDDIIVDITKDSVAYMKACRKSRKLSEGFWLEKNIDMWDELYRFPYQLDKRVNLNKINNV